MSKSRSIKLKTLQAQKSKIEARMTNHKMEKSIIDKNIHNLSVNLLNINMEIDEINKQFKDIEVSDHAIVRYVERVLGIDIEELKRKICPDEKRELIKQLGDGKYEVEGEFKLIVSNNTIVTVCDK